MVAATTPNRFSRHAIVAALRRAGGVFYDGTTALANELDSRKAAGAQIVLVPALACDRVLAAVVLSRLPFTLVDCAPGALQPSMQQYLAAASGRLSSDTVLIIAGHWGHWPGDIETIAETAARAGAPVIWDAANSWGLSGCPDNESRWSVLSFGAAKPVDLGMGAVSASRFTSGRMLICSRSDYDGFMQRLHANREDRRGLPALQLFRRFIEANSGARCELEPAALMQRAEARATALDLRVQRQRRVSDFLVESAESGGWLRLNCVPTLSFHTRLIALTEERDLVAMKLRRLGAWIGSESMTPLGLLLQPELAPNTNEIARSALSLLTAQPAAALSAVGHALRFGL